VGTVKICALQYKPDGNRFRKAYDCCDQFEVGSKYDYFVS
jgi:hypothetical protein